MTAFEALRRLVRMRGTAPVSTWRAASPVVGYSRDGHAIAVFGLATPLPTTPLSITVDTLSNSHLVDSRHLCVRTNAAGEARLILLYADVSPASLTGWRVRLGEKMRGRVLDVAADTPLGVEPLCFEGPFLFVPGATALLFNPDHRVLQRARCGMVNRMGDWRLERNPDVAAELRRGATICRTCCAPRSGHAPAAAT